MRLTATFLLIALLATGQALAAQDVAGIIKSVEGSGSILRDGENMPAKAGEALFVHDTVLTGDDSSMGIMLEDDTLVSLGEHSRLEIDNFAFEPKNEIFAIAIRLLKGSFAYMSGVIGRLAPEKVDIETPDAVIAIHGTRLLVKVEGN
jgi:hypothetical protein